MLKTILKQSWQVVWHNPVLWIFGFLNTFLLGNEINLLVNNANRFSNNIFSLLGAKTLDQYPNYFEFLKKIISHPSLISGLLVFLLLLILFGLAILSQIGLITGIKSLKDGEKISFGQLIKDSWPRFWPAFLLNFFNTVILYLFFLIISLPFAHLFLKFGQTIWLLIYIVLNIIILFPLSFIISFIIRFAIIDQVLNQENLVSSLKKSFSFFIRYWLKIIGLTIILAVIGLAVGLILFILATTISVPFLFLSNFFYRLGVLTGFWLMISFGLLLIFLLFCFLGSIFSAFQSAVWILFFRRSYDVEKK